MTNNTDNNKLPDLTGIFDIDEKDIPKKIIKRDNDISSKKVEPILTSDEAMKTLPVKERKALKDDRKMRKRHAFNKSMRKKAALLGVIAVAVIIVLMSTANNDKKNAPKVELTSPTITTLSEYFTSESVTVIDTVQGKTVVFFDNEYSVHNIKTGQKAVATTLDGKTVECTVKTITAEEPDSSVIKNYYEKLTGKKAATVIYTVYALPNTQDAFENNIDIKSFTVTTNTVQNALTVPKDAVLVKEDESGSEFYRKYYVFVYSKKDSSISELQISVGIINDEVYEVTAALPPDAQIVVSSSNGLSELSDGMKVRVK